MQHQQHSNNKNDGKVRKLISAVTMIHSFFFITTRQMLKVNLAV